MPEFRRLPLVALLTAAAGATHIAAAVPHFADDAMFGVSFVAAGWVQLALAAALLLWPGRSVLGATALVNVLALVAWLLSRTAGLPLGHPGPEPVALADAITVALELAAVALLAARWAGSRILLGRTAGTVGALSIAALVATGGSATAIAALGTTGPGHDQNAATRNDDHQADDAQHDHGADRSDTTTKDAAHEHADGTWHLHKRGEAHEHLDGTIHVHAASAEGGTPGDAEDHDDGHDHTH